MSWWNNCMIKELYDGIIAWWNIDTPIEPRTTEPRMTEPRKTQPRRDPTPNRPKTLNWLNPEWTQHQRDSTPNGLNPERTQPRMDSTLRGSTAKGLYLEWTQPRMDSTPKALNPDWDSTPNGIHPEWASTLKWLNPDWDSTPKGLNLEFFSTSNGTISSSKYKHFTVFFEQESGCIRISKEWNCIMKDCLSLVCVVLRACTFMHPVQLYTRDKPVFS
jgi:hypothetical protein